MGDWTDLLPRLGQTDGLAEFAQSVQNSRSANAQNDAQTQLIGQQIAGAQQKAQQQQQYQLAVAQALNETDPKRQNAAISQIALKFPDQVEPVKAYWGQMDSQRRTADMGTLNDIVSAIDNGRPDLAATTIDQRIAAEKAAGLDTSADESWRDTIKAGDKKGIAFVRGAAIGHLAAADPARFSENYKTAATPGSPFNLTPGAERVSPDGSVIARAPTAAKPVSVPIFDTNGKRVGTRVGTIDENGNFVEGGDPGSGAPGAVTPPGGPGAPSGRTRFGWTPRARNGGDNPDAVVDNKIAGMASALGVGPNDSIAGLSPMAIAQALTLSEGGPGSLADRNNNPGNLTDGKGGYRKFPTKEAGLAAAAAQVARNLKRGQNTIRTMVEGLPVGGAAPQTGAPSPSPARGGGYIGPVAAAGSAGNGGASDDAVANDAWAYISGGLKMQPGMARNTAYQTSVRNKAAELMRQNGISAQDALRGGQDFKAATKFIAEMADTKPGTAGGIVRSANVATEHLSQLRRAFLALQNGDVPTFNRISQWWQTNVGAPLPSEARALSVVTAGEISKMITGANGALDDRRGVLDQIPTFSSPSQSIGVIDQLAHAGAAQVQGILKAYTANTGRDPSTFAKYLTPRVARLIGLKGQASNGGASGGAGPLQAAGAALPQVKSFQQAMALPKGTVFIDPYGKKRVRP